MTSMLEKISEYFYDPMVFWLTPFVLVALTGGWRKLWTTRRRSFEGELSGKDAKDLQQRDEKA